MNWILLVIVAVLILVLFIIIKKVTKIFFKLAFLVVAFLLAFYIYNNYFAPQQMPVGNDTVVQQLPNATLPETNITPSLNTSAEQPTQPNINSPPS